MIKYILSKSNIMINYVGFTIVWFSCVYSGAKGDPIIALIPTFIFLFLHFLIVTDHLKEEIQLIVISIGVGVIILKPIDDGVIFSRFSGFEKNSNTVSISLGTNCSL